MAEAAGRTQTVGWLLSAMSVGALAIGLFSGWTGRVVRHGRAVLNAAAVWVLGIVALGFAPSLGLALLCLAVAGAADMVSGVCRGPVWNETIPHALRGRLADIEMIAYLTGPLLGNVRAGFMAARWGRRRRSGGAARPDWRAWWSPVWRCPVSGPTAAAARACRPRPGRRSRLRAAACAGGRCKAPGGPRNGQETSASYRCAADRVPPPPNPPGARPMPATPSSAAVALSSRLTPHAPPKRQRVPDRRGRVPPRPAVVGLQGAAARLVLVSMVFVALYAACNQLSHARGGIAGGVFVWERGIPFVPWTVVPYLSIFAFFVASFVIHRGSRALDRYCTALLLNLGIALACYACVPLQFTFERPLPDGVFRPLFQLLHAVDLPYNRAPSLHISVLVLLWWRLRPALGPVGRAVVGAWFCLIALSVLTTYQHHVIDIPAGVAAAWASLALAHRVPLAGAIRWIASRGATGPRPGRPQSMQTRSRPSDLVR